MQRWAKPLWYVSLAVLIIQAGAAYSSLPDTIATHFSIDGQADDYSSKDVFFPLWFVLVAVINMWVPLMPTMIRKIPESLISTPNREFWLADHSRKELFIQKMTDLSALISVAVNGMFFWMMYHTVRFNVDGEEFPGGVSLIVVIVILTVVLTLLPFLVLKKPQE